MNTKNSLTLSMAAAALLVAGCASESKSQPSGTATQQSLIKCEGVNECKGTSECKSATNANGCHGLNDCKGQGWITIPKAECDSKGGKILAEGPASGGPAAGDAATTPVATDIDAGGKKTASIKCEGINECKGHSDCAGEMNGCKGQNECKGQGYLEIPTEAGCLEKGGTVKA